MATPGNAPDDTPDAPPTDAVGRTGPPPGYDAGIEGYAGISAGALDNPDDVEAARNLAEMVVDTVREGLLVLDLDLRVEAANESFYRQFRVSPEETVGELVYELGNGQWDLPELRELLEDILPHEKAFDDFEVDHEFERVGRRVVILNARRLNDHHMILLAVEDVTERREAARSLRDLSQALEEAEEAERRRLAGVLHDDLQQILTGAQIQAQLGRTDRVAELLGEAARTARALSHELVPPVLDDERLPVLLEWLAVRCRERFGLEVEVDAGAEENLLVPERSLRALIYHVLRELLFNVAKHAGTGRARVTAERTDGHVAVTVSDEGAGFGPGRSDGGAGLGLSGVRERIQLVGGRLDVVSAPGEGTVVTAVVPLHLEGL